MPRQRSVLGGERGETPPSGCPLTGFHCHHIAFRRGSHSAARCRLQQRVQGTGGEAPGLLPCPGRSERGGGSRDQGHPGDQICAQLWGFHWGKRCDLTQLLPRSLGRTIPPLPDKMEALERVMHAAAAPLLPAALWGLCSAVSTRVWWAPGTRCDSMAQLPIPTCIDFIIIIIITILVVIVTFNPHAGAGSPAARWRPIANLWRYWWVGIGAPRAAPSPGLAAAPGNRASKGRWALSPKSCSVHELFVWVQCSAGRPHGCHGKTWVGVAVLPPA